MHKLFLVVALFILNKSTMSQMLKQGTIVVLKIESPMYLEEDIKMFYFKEFYIITSKKIKLDTPKTKIYCETINELLVALKNYFKGAFIENRPVERFLEKDLYKSYLQDSLLQKIFKKCDNIAVVDSAEYSSKVYLQIRKVSFIVDTIKSKKCINRDRAKYNCKDNEYVIIRKLKALDCESLNLHNFLSKLVLSDKFVIFPEIYDNTNWKQKN
jgi:hypothetical protein